MTVKEIIEDAEKRLSTIYLKQIKLAIIPAKNSAPDEVVRFYHLLVCNALGIPFNDIFQARGKREITDARMLIMYYSNLYYKIGPSKIARYLKKDHTTVLHGLGTVKDRIAVKDTELLHVMNIIEKELEDHKHNEA